VALLSERFRSAWKKVGTFTVVKSGGKVVEKRGGSVAAYFMTPDGRVLGAALGAARADYFLDEASWALERAADVAHPTRFPAAHLARSKKILATPGWVSLG